MTVPAVSSRSPASLSALSGRAFMAASSSVGQGGSGGSRMAEAAAQQPVLSYNGFGSKKDVADVQLLAEWQLATINPALSQCQVSATGAISLSVLSGRAFMEASSNTGV